MNIRNKFLIYTLLPLLIIFPLLSYFVLKQQENTERKRLREKITYTSKLINLNMSGIINNYDLELLNQQCDAFFSDEEIISLHIYDPNATGNNNFLCKKENNDEIYDQHKKINIQVPITKGDKLLADAEIIYTEAYIHEKLSSIRLTLLLISLTIIGGFSIIYLILSNIISKPIASIIKSLNIVNEGDLDHRLDLKQQDEFKSIEQHFNKMVGSIKMQKDSLLNTNRRLQEEIEARNHSNQLLSNVINNIPFSVFWKNTDLEFLGCNQNFLDDLNCTREELLNKTDAIFLQNSQLSNFFEHNDRLIISQRRPLLNLEHTEIIDGKEHVISTSKVPLLSADGEVIGLLGIYKDITERKAKERELKRAKESAENANKAKSNFLSSMSHEIRTPMNSIMGARDILSYTNLSEQQKEYLDIIQDSSENLLKVIDNILDTSRIEAGDELYLNIDNFNLEELLSNLIKKVAPLAHEKGLYFTYKIAPNVFTELVGDVKRISQMVFAVLENAVKFTVKGGITLTVNQENEKGDKSDIIFSISDTGIGISPQNLESIFEPFIQVETSYNRSFSGTGLGLSIAQNIAQLMNGEIQLHSIVNEGSVFNCRVEIVHSSEKRPSYTYPKKELNNKLIFIANDSHSVNTYWKEVLLFSHAQVVSSVSIETGADLLLEHKNDIDAIVIPLFAHHKSIKTAVEMLHNIQNRHPDIDFSKIIVAVRSNNSEIQQEMIAQLKKLGIKAFLTSPILPQELLDFLAEFINKNNSYKEQVNDAKALADADNLLTAKQTSSNSKAATVLLVDDHAINRNVAKLMLQKVGCKVIVANNGQEAIERFSETIDLILMDIQMPVLDGIEATKRIRLMPGGKDVPIIALTTHSLTKDRQKMQDAGITEYLTKPIVSNVFNELLSQYIPITIEKKAINT